MKFYLLASLLVLAGCSSSSPTASSSAPIPEFTPYISAVQVNDSDVRSITHNRLAMLEMVISQYVQHTGQFPDFSTPGTMRNAVYPFSALKVTDYYLHPVTGHLFVPNANLSRRSKLKIKNLAGVPLVWEADPGSNQTRCVVWADGHMQQVNESQWQTIKKANKIP